MTDIHVHIFINFYNENEYSFTLLCRFCLQDLTTGNKLGVLLQAYPSSTAMLVGCQCYYRNCLPFVYSYDGRVSVLLQELLRLQLCWCYLFCFLCCVFLFYLSSFCVLCLILSLSSGLSILDYPFVVI